MHQRKCYRKMLVLSLEEELGSRQEAQAFWAHRKLSKEAQSTDPLRTVSSAMGTQIQIYTQGS